MQKYPLPHKTILYHIFWYLWSFSCINFPSFFLRGGRAGPAPCFCFFLEKSWTIFFKGVGGWAWQKWKINPFLAFQLEQLSRWPFPLVPWPPLTTMQCFELWHNFRVTPDTCHYFCAADYLRLPKFSLTNWCIFRENTPNFHKFVCVWFYGQNHLYFRLF